MVVRIRATALAGACLRLSKKSYYTLFQESPGWLLRLGLVLSTAMELIFKKGWARRLYLSD